jgi:hypothetical protein
VGRVKLGAVQQAPRVVRRHLIPTGRGLSSALSIPGSGGSEGGGVKKWGKRRVYGVHVAWQVDLLSFKAQGNAARSEVAHTPNITHTSFRIPSSPSTITSVRRITGSLMGYV